MLTHHRKPVCLSLVSTDLPVWSVLETAATLYQKNSEQFHLLLSAPSLKSSSEVIPTPRETFATEKVNTIANSGPRILWLEISPYRVTMTMQGNAQLSYRHFWERGVYGMSRYWLPIDSLQPSQPIRLRNFTRAMTLSRHTLPEHLRLEYELWAGKVQLGCYILNLEIKH